MSSLIKVEPPDCVEVEILLSPVDSIYSMDYEDDTQKIFVEVNEKNEETVVPSTSMTKVAPELSPVDNDSADKSKPEALTSKSMSPFKITLADEHYTTFNFKMESVVIDPVVTTKDSNVLMSMLSGSTSDPLSIRIEKDIIFEPAEKKEKVSSPIVKVKTDPVEIRNDAFEVSTTKPLVMLPITESISSVSINFESDTISKPGLSEKKGRFSPIPKTEHAEIRIGDSAQTSTVLMPKSEPNSINSEFEDTTDKPLFELNEKVLSFHGPLLYDAKILRRRTTAHNSISLFKGKFEYYVHFLGWGKRYDTWISEVLLLKCTPDNTEIQKMTELAVKKSVSSSKKSSKKKSSKTTDSSLPNGEGKNYTVNETKAGTGIAIGVSHAVPPDPDVDTKDNRLLRSLMQCVESVTLFQNTPQVLIIIPTKLKQVLFDDWVLVVQKQQLLDLPAHACVDKILNDYFVARGDTKGSPEDQFTSEIDKMFKEEIEYLMYPPEKSQFEFVSVCQKDIYDSLPEGEEIVEDFTSVYGLVHLLRMISILGDIIAFSPLGVEDIERLQQHMSDFLKFLEENVENYFDPKQYTLSPEDYESASDFISESVQSVSPIQAITESEMSEN